MSTPMDSVVIEPIDPANSVLGKLTLLLGAFGFDNPDLSLTELVRRSGLTKPTVHRLCGELIHWGYLERSGTDYRLGIRLFEIGQRVGSQRQLRDAARPFMEDVQRMTGGVVHLAVRYGTEVLYLDKITGHRVVQPSRIAGRMPMHCTATGKVLLAFASPELLRMVVAAGLTRMTRHTITAPGSLAHELAQVRRAHLSKEVEETRLGYLSMAAPIRDAAGSVIAALSATVPSARANLPLISRGVRNAAHSTSDSVARADPPGAADGTGGAVRPAPSRADYGEE